MLELAELPDRRARAGRGRDRGRGGRGQPRRPAAAPGSLPATAGGERHPRAGGVRARRGGRRRGRPAGRSATPASRCWPAAATPSTSWRSRRARWCRRRTGSTCVTAGGRDRGGRHRRSPTSSLAGLAAGERLLVHGGAGGIGSFAIPYAKHLGATVITTAGSAEKLDYCRSLGADHAISYRDDWPAAVRDATRRPRRRRDLGQHGREVPGADTSSCWRPAAGWW